jgi:beta-galactosidase
VLKAVGYKEGQPGAECQVKTVGAPARIRLTPDRDTLKAEPGDLCYVTAEVVDQDGLVHPSADHELFFTVQGAGEIAAVGSSNPVSTERYRGNQRRAHRGRCLVVVKSRGESGEIHLHAQADGLDGAELLIEVA